MTITADRVLETTNSTGAGPITLAGAALGGYQTFAAAFALNTAFWYVIEDSTNNAWEIGVGHLSSNTTLARDSILTSSTGTAVAFGAGVKRVFATIPAAALNNFAAASAAKLATARAINGVLFDGTADITIAVGPGATATNLSIAIGATDIAINSDTGADVTIPSATPTAAGVMSAADKVKIAGIPTPVTAVSGVTYDGAGRVTGYTKNSTAYSVTYPNATTIVVAGGGKTTTITLDAQGRFSAMSVV